MLVSDFSQRMGKAQEKIMQASTGQYLLHPSPPLPNPSPLIHLPPFRWPPLRPVWLYTPPALGYLLFFLCVRSSEISAQWLATTMAGGATIGTSVCLLSVGCLTSQQHASVSQGRICLDNFTCCHTEIEVADQTFYLTQSQYTDTRPTSPSADPITPGTWQGSHWSASI